LLHPESKFWFFSVGILPNKPAVFDQHCKNNKSSGNCFSFKAHGIATILYISFILSLLFTRENSISLPFLLTTKNFTGCCSLVVVLSLSKREVVSSSPAQTGRVKPKAFEIGSGCSFAKSTAFRSENHGSFRYDLKNGGPVSQKVWHVKEPSLLKAVSAKHRSKCAALSPVMMTVARQLKNCSCESKERKIVTQGKGWVG
jgi:hypothetical protein